MIYVGIDIAKLNRYAAVLSSDGIVLTEPFKFTNDDNGFKMLHSEFPDYTPESIVILDIMDLKILGRFRKTPEVADTVNNPGDFVCGSSLLRVAIFLQIRFASKVCLCASRGGAFAEVDCLIQQRYGKKIKSSCTEVRRLQRQYCIYSDNSDHLTD